MNLISLIFLIVNAALLLTLPKKWAALPLLIGTCYMTVMQKVEIENLNFTIVRLIILIGFVRIILRREKPLGRLQTLDKLMLIWSALAIFSSVFHKDPINALILRCGLVYDYAGVYFLIRAFCRTEEELNTLCMMITVIIVPIAIEMSIERMTGHNCFSVLGGVPSMPVERTNGTFRAQGPFAHSILAGTMGAVCFPLVITVWNRKRWIALIGMFACVVIVLTSNSSGPIMSLAAAVFALLFWYRRKDLKSFLALGVCAYLMLLIVMSDPPYYILARIDLTGGSTGWHRARLIQSSIEHLPEWWFAGTDYTRSWMPTGVPWNPDHTDITNYYLKMGVWGGLPLMLAFMAIVVKAVLMIITKVSDGNYTIQQKFIFWAILSSLVSHAATFIAVSYYDQSFVFFYSNLALIASIAGFPKADTLERIQYDTHESAPFLKMRKYL